ncbi:MAG: cytochrome c peroxidase, partial [Pseudomonadota bacterium]
MVIAMACFVLPAHALSPDIRNNLRLGAQDFPPINQKQAALGQKLFYDPILSGNNNISCGVCHHHRLFGGDGLSLGLGEGGENVGKDRTAGMGENRIKRRVPRNAPSLFNLGAKEIHTLFHDGRVRIHDLYGNGFSTPAEEFLPPSMQSLLAVQALFPIQSEIEMAGNSGENEIAGARFERIDRAWDVLIAKLRAIPEYVTLFADAFDDVEDAGDIHIAHMGNAIGQFISGEWQSYDSPWDEYLAGNDDALLASQKAGMALFFGKGNCAQCHSGKLFSDQKFYNLAVPQFGPGRTRKFDPMPRDVGRMGFTDRLEDAYRFRTPPLRNVALTAPYGHNG